MRIDGGRSVIQTNVRQWADKTGTKNPPFLDVREKDRSVGGGSKPLIVRAEENYPVGLGLNANGFAVRDGTRVSVPKIALAVWIGRTAAIPDGRDPMQFLLQHMKDTLHISAAEEAAVLIDKPLDVTCADIAENRVLAAAGWVAAGLVSERADLEPWQSSLVFKWRKAFHRPDSLRGDLAETARGLANGEYGGPRGHYVHALTLARLILGQAGMSQEGRTRVMGDALLVNSATLFEEYVRSVLARACKAMGLTVTKGGSPVQTLYDDGSFGLVPDIRISRGLSTLALGDAKYKEPDSGDHYQMAAYMRSYGVSRAFLLCPDYGDAREAVTRRRAPDGRSVLEIRLPLWDLDASEELLANLHQILPFPLA